MARFKKYLGWAGIAFVVFFLITQPVAAADFVGNVFAGLGSAAESLSTFVNALVV
ncbi:hypothetical protein [Allonocardiopsis opalescens]|uniref:Uncharacterized protein n=1 Tax=Allonocardiopsis opalescens TaxID=1144618 RepID=A0A2T0Q6V0_9ACTN|nr:hypothetical protein [Allonocardiopsis opalescens]PRX99522.1 hypothetical protein CLV72_103123 [Allonocardiopsis opalescens]